MVKFFGLRLSRQGIALIWKFRVIGHGTEDFIREVAAEVGGPDTSRKHRLPSSLADELVKDHDGLD